MQDNHDLWQAKQHVKVGKVRLTAAEKKLTAKWEATKKGKRGGG